MSKRESSFDQNSFYWGLLSAREPKLLSGLAEFERLSQLFKQGDIKQVRRILQSRANRGVGYWMRMFGSKRGRPIDRRLREKWAIAVFAEKQGFARSQLTGLVDSGGLADAAKDRLRKGIGTIKKVKQAAHERKKGNP